jgi:hypothetical protein
MKRYYRPPKFTFQDFIVRFSVEENVPVSSVEQTVYSRYTYNKLQTILRERSQPKNETITSQVLCLPDDLAVEKRIPRRQLLIEMTAVIKEHLSRVRHILYLLWISFTMYICTV